MREWKGAREDLRDTSGRPLPAFLQIDAASMQGSEGVGQASRQDEVLDERVDGKRGGSQPGHEPPKRCCNGGKDDVQVDEQSGERRELLGLLL